MLSRRRMLSGIGAAGAARLALNSRGALAAAPSTVKTPVDFAVPRGACDCHVHIFDPVHFPYFSGRLYTPPEASIDDLIALQSALHFDRVVVVTPSVYGIDNLWNNENESDQRLNREATPQRSQSTAATCLAA